MSFLLENRLGTDITTIIKDFTKPKKYYDYKDTLYIPKRRISNLYKNNIEVTDENELYYYANDYLFRQNLKYNGYSLFLGLIDLKYYYHINGSLGLYLIYDEFPLVIVEILILKSNGTIYERYKCQEDYCLGGYIIGNRLREKNYRYNITKKSKLNTLELEYWNNLEKNSIKILELILTKFHNNKIPIQYKLINE